MRSPALLNEVCSGKAGLQVLMKTFGILKVGNHFLLLILPLQLPGFLKIKVGVFLPGVLTALYL